MRQRARRDGEVVVDEIALRQPLFREEDLVGVGDLDLVTTHTHPANVWARSPGPNKRRGRDLNPRWTFQPIRDFQSRSLDRSDTSPSAPSVSGHARVDSPRREE